MKKTIIYTILILVFTSLVYSFTEKLKNSERFIEIPITENTTFSILEKNGTIVNINSGSFEDEIKTGKFYFYNFYEADSNFIENINKQFLNDEPKGQNYGVILYLKPNTNGFKRNNIIAIGSYNIIEGELKHKLYFNNNGIFVSNDSYYDFQAVDITFNDFEVIGRKIGSNNIVGINNKQKFNYEKFDGFYLKKIIENNKINNYGKNGDIPIGLMTPDCGVACPKQSIGDYCVGTGCAGIDPSNCSSERAIKDKIKNSDLINLSYLEKFRDEFMLKYDIGRKYKNYYYILSADLIKMPTSDFQKLGEIIPLILSKVKLLYNSQENSKEILITEKEAFVIREVINNLSKLNSTEDFQFMMRDVTKDIEYYKNKSVEKVLSEIK